MHLARGNFNVSCRPINEADDKSEEISNEIMAAPPKWRLAMVARMADLADNRL